MATVHSTVAVIDSNEAKMAPPVGPTSVCHLDPSMRQQPVRFLVAGDCDVHVGRIHRTEHLAGRIIEPVGQITLATSRSRW